MMSIFWKIFLSVITVAAFTFTIGGHIMIYAAFHTSLDRVTSSAKQENTSLRTALAAAVNNTPHNGDIPAETLGKIASELEITTSSGTLRFTLSDSSYNTLFSNDSLSLDFDTASNLPDHTQNVTIRQIDQNYYIFVLTKTTLENQIFYFQNVMDITAVFDQKNILYGIFQILLLALLFVIGFVILILTLWITRPIKRLSNATKEIADGDFTKRVKALGNDEIGTLSRDFNTMADHLEQNMTELKNAVRRQEDFVGNFTHELKTPLTSIIGYADILRSKKLSEEEQLFYADYIFQEGKRLNALSLKLMEILILEQEKLQKQPVSALYFIQNVGTSVDPMLKQSHIVLKISVQDTPISLEFDLMKTVLMNLIDNSRKAMPNGGTIQIFGKQTTEGYRFTLEDTGMGIAAEELPKITEAFYMVDKSRARKQGGAGIGLALCSKIVALHNGTMEFSSQPGKGTTVTIFLPKEEEI